MPGILRKLFPYIIIFLFEILENIRLVLNESNEQISQIETFIWKGKEDLALIKVL